MKKIQLKNGLFTIVDDADYEWLNKWKWHGTWNPSAKTYYVWRGDGNTTMHRMILNATKGILVDHKNHDTLDNRRVNLRLATRTQNAANKKIPSNNTSGFKGVSWHKRNKKFRASVMLSYKEIHLGYFDDPKEGAKAYNKKAKELFGEFALLNEI